MQNLTVTGASYKVGGKQVLLDASFTALAGQITGIVGANGSGKSTLLRGLLGVGPLDRGMSMFGDEDLLGMSHRRRARMSALVQQTVSSTMHMSVLDAVLLGRMPFQPVWRTLPPPEDEELAKATLARLGMTEFTHHIYQSLSGGEQQRLQIARALAQTPKLLVLDEPTNHLDIHAQLSAMRVLRQEAERGVTVVLAIHDLNLASRYCDRLVLMYQGEVLECGTPEQVLSPALLRKAYSIEAQLITLTQSARPILLYDLPE